MIPPALHETSSTSMSVEQIGAVIMSSGFSELPDDMSALLTLLFLVHLSNVESQPYSRSAIFSQCKIV